ncbi:hypothetical protein TEQG_08858 [Trichophyton equinum CBS 127.97]|uniref:Uncharacterized protein n=1 Tax=Trichophyton equinum (strain ATCC MYA-4606 / CBS 127.97) TaxID=559882 RepID=F2Q611_TRIEC|nr:hypothetical protein TEQG_08858 [Trichophyton equinum CBS 127.97]
MAPASDKRRHVEEQNLPMSSELYVRIEREGKPPPKPMRLFQEPSRDATDESEESEHLREQTSQAMASAKSSKMK